MKKNRLIGILLLWPCFVFSQPCKSPVSANQFKQYLNQMALQADDPMKLKLSEDILQASCLLSTQVKDLAMVFAGDYYRYEFCKEAWKHTFDPVNFFDVYDAFQSKSAAFRLYDDIRLQREK